jgi:hypothetical protein
MTDVNEEIVKAYYEAQGYVVKTNHYYVKKKFKEEKKIGQGPSDIDLIVIHPKTKDRAIISVKGWHNDKVIRSNLHKKWEQKDYSKLNIDKQTIVAGENFFGDAKFRKILVLSCIDTKDYKYLVEELKKFYGYDEIIDFPTILKDLIDGNKEKGIPLFDQFKNYKDSEFLQSLRIFIKYYIGKKEKRLNKSE